MSTAATVRGRVGRRAARRGSGHRLATVIAFGLVVLAGGGWWHWSASRPRRNPVATVAPPAIGPRGAAVAPVREVGVAMTADQYRAALVKRARRLTEEMARRGADPEIRAHIAAELRLVHARLADVGTSLAEFTAALVQAQHALDGLDDPSILPEEVAEARQRVADGDAAFIEDLFARIQLGPSSARSAEAAYGLGALAEAEGELRNAAFYYRRSLLLDPRAGAARQALAALVDRLEAPAIDHPPAADLSGPASPGAADGGGRVLDGEITFPLTGQLRVRAPLGVVGEIRNTTRSMHYWLALRSGRAAGPPLLQTPRLMTVETQRVDGGELRTMLRFHRVIANPPAGSFTLLLYGVPDEGERVLDARVGRGEVGLEPLPPGAILLDRVSLNTASPR